MKTAFKHRRINFLPPENRPSPLSPAVIAVVFLCCLLGVPLLGGGAKVARWSAERRLSSLSSARDSLAAQVASNVKARDSSVDQRAVSAVKTALSQKLYWAEVFKELSNVAPKGVWLTTFDTSVAEGVKKVVIAGEGISQAEIAEFFSRLEKSYYFRNVQMKFTEAATESATKFRFQFEGSVFDEKKGGNDGSS